MSTDVHVRRLQGWRPPSGGGIAFTGLTLLAILIVIWATAVAVTTGSPFVALFAFAVTALLVIALWLLFAKVRSVQPLVVHVIASEGRVTFDAGDGPRRALRWLAPVGILLLVSLVALLVRDELYGKPGAAVFSGLSRYGSLALFVAGIGVIAPGIRAWRGASSSSLVLTPHAVTLRVLRTGGRAEWQHITSAGFAAQRVTVFAGTGSFSWACRDLASDPVVLADLINYYIRHPEERANIGIETIALLQSGDF